MIDRTWYKKLKRSSLSPPDYVFKIVWPLLYTLLTISFIILVQIVSAREYANLFLFS